MWWSPQAWISYHGVILHSAVVAFLPRYYVSAEVLSRDIFTSVFIKESRWSSWMWIFIPCFHTAFIFNHILHKYYTSVGILLGDIFVWILTRNCMMESVGVNNILHSHIKYNYNCYSITCSFVLWEVAFTYFMHHNFQMYFWGRDKIACKLCE